MLLPKPHLSFTLPSIHDNTKLQCRIYHPPCLLLHECESEVEHGVQGRKKWLGDAAVVAHPYAPLGGCYDDPVVDVLAGTLLHLGFVVATFNFRGAAPSEGRTSWTAKPEQGDYVSVVGFLAYYVHYLSSSLSPSASPRQPLPVMCLAGYSYGAMITMRTPPLDEILAYFAAPPIHSAEADVRLRAQHLAEVQSALLASVDPASPRRSQGMRFGEGAGDASRRKAKRSSGSSSFVALSGFNHHLHQHEQKEEKIQKSVADLKAGTKRLRLRRESRYPRWSGQNQGQDRSENGVGSSNDEREEMRKEEECLHPVEGGDIAFGSAYIVVSPPVGFMTRLATMSFSLSNPFSAITSTPPSAPTPATSPSISSSSLLSWLRRPHSQSQTRSTTQHQQQQQQHIPAKVTDYESKLTMNPTLVIYGDQDGFISQRRIREWTRHLSQTPTQTQTKTQVTQEDHASPFRYIEVSGTGHFWVEGDSLYRLRDAIGIFATALTTRTG